MKVNRTVQIYARIAHDKVKNAQSIAQIVMQNAENCKKIEKRLANAAQIL